MVVAFCGISLFITFSCTDISKQSTSMYKHCWTVVWENATGKLPPWPSHSYHAYMSAMYNFTFQWTWNQKAKIYLALGSNPRQCACKSFSISTALPVLLLESDIHRTSITPRSVWVCCRDLCKAEVCCLGEASLGGVSCWAHTDRLIGWPTASQPSCWTREPATQMLAQARCQVDLEVCKFRSS